MPQSLRVTRSLCIPDGKKLALYRRAPELGPKVLFFSGGTALRDLSRRIIAYTHNSVHIVTPFDSGGSSAVIRKAFKMLAVGDIRNRLMALADRSLHGNPEIFELFAYRFSKDASPSELQGELDRMLKGRHERIRVVPDPMRKIVRSHLAFFADRMPKDFNLAGASVGNLILTGGFFNNDRHIDPVIFLFTKLVEARGIVRPVVNKDLHLVSELADGTRLVGQHMLTGKQAEPIASPVARVYLAANPDQPAQAKVEIRPKVRELIASADLICFPMGSFYSSVVANLLPKGVGEAVRRAQCPKVFIPNLGHDPEMIGMSLADCVTRLYQYLDAGCEGKSPRDSLLNFVLLDSVRGRYQGPLELKKMQRYGVEVIDAPLVSDDSAPLLDSNALIEHLLSLT